ncbi:Uma2 family endonuclease [Fodinicola acaciae]|uniref:Uma2 family endonuclease n=1 Tax=Fodinicola acaciae TaxID=2681555 RepID=UPI001C9E5DB2|nr:Uma2 family endonuclease [Fodinicola acaciae]
MSLDDFDPLVELAGMWTAEFADRYLPIDGAHPARYEAINGRLVMSPREGSANSWAAKRLAIGLDAAATAAGHALYPALNVIFTPDTWIGPDLVVLRQPVSRMTWVPAEHVLMRSSSSRRRLGAATA